MGGWFWTKFSLLIVLIVSVIAFLLPSANRTFLPVSINQFIDSHALKLGIDLSGGTKLEYQVDFSSALQKAKLAGKTEAEMVDKKQIAEGVAKTLKKRVDPDGTKEVSVFASQRGDDWFVVVELTHDIDTPENRGKLEKVTSLSFKEPYETPAEAKASADVILQGAIAKKTSFEDLALSLQSGGEATVSLAKEGYTPDSLSSVIGKEAADAIFSSSAVGAWHPTVILNNDQQFFVFIEGLSQDVAGQKTLKAKVLQYTGRWKETALGGSQFTMAKVGTDPNTNYPVTSIEFTLEGSALFGQITEKLATHTNPLCGGKGDVFAIFVDGKMVSDPCVREKISGNAQISFGSTKGASMQSVQAEAQQLADNLNSGATPAPVDLIGEQTISPTLGDAALFLSLKAFIIGFIILSLWMVWSYRWYGVLAVLALSFYSLALIAIFKLTGFVITLPGIAGMVLSVGMAVDANILIFERTREEFQKGKDFKEAIAEGFDRAWTSIRDSNTSSLLTCFILWAVGTSIIKAFAITLSAGIVLSLFTAITVTRYFIAAATPKSWESKPALLLGK